MSLFEQSKKMKQVKVIEVYAWFSFRYNKYLPFSTQAGTLWSPEDEKWLSGLLRHDIASEWQSLVLKVNACFPSTLWKPMNIYWAHGHPPDLLCCRNNFGFLDLCLFHHSWLKLEVTLNTKWQRTRIQRWNKSSNHKGLQNHVSRGVGHGY